MTDYVEAFSNILGTNFEQDGESAMHRWLSRRSHMDQIRERGAQWLNWRTSFSCTIGPPTGCVRANSSTMLLKRRKPTRLPRRERARAN